MYVLTSPYGLSKYCGKFYIKHYCEELGICWQCLRFSQVYDTNEPIVRIIPITKNALISDKLFSLYTDGQEKRRFLYVNDASEAIGGALLSDRKGIYNIAGKDVCTMEELARIMEHVYEKKLRKRIQPGIGLVPKFMQP